jgi:hypothetical protein
LIHREIETDELFHPLSDDILRQARRFPSFPVLFPDTTFLERTGHVQTHEQVFNLWLMTTHVVYLLPLGSTDRLLFEAIMLHKLIDVFPPDTLSDRERRSVGVLQTMLQHRLTCLFLDLSPEDVWRVYRLGSTGGLHQDEWEMAIVGAASSARAIKTFLEIDGYRVFLPTIYEDFHLGVDFIVLGDDGLDWCVGASSGYLDSPIYIEEVHTCPPIEDQRRAANNRRRIFSGTERFNELYHGSTFRAARVSVGKTNGERFDPNLYVEDIAIVSKFLKRDRIPFVEAAARTA